MKFFKTILNSIYSPQFYSEILQANLHKALGYFFLLILLLTIVQTATVIKPIFYDTSKNIKLVVNEVVNQYPKELEIKVNKGQVTTNVTEPYFIPFPEGSNGFKDLIVIDTKTPYSAAQFNAYQSVVWVTKDSIFYKDHNSLQTKSLDVSQLGNFTLNKETLDSLVSQYSPYLNFIGPILLIFAILGFFMLYTLRLVYLLLLALLIWLLSIIFKWNLNYSSSYKVGLYGMTFAFLLEILVGVTQIYTHFSGFPFMFTLITLATVTVNMLHANKS